MKPTLILLALLVFSSATSLAQPNESPKKITAGTHHCSHDNGADEWFVYRPEASTWVILSSVDKTDTDTYVEVYYEGHNTPFLRSDDYKNGQSRIKFIAEADSSYLIKWRGIYAQTGYDWELTRETLLPGEHHSTAIEFTGEENMTTQIYPGKLVWYKYSCTKNQWVDLTSNYEGYSVYEQTPNEDHLIKESFSLNNGESFTFSPTQGTTYYFCWENESSSFVDLSWNLSEKTPIEGKTPDNPAVLPINKTTELEKTEGIDNWFSFSNDSAGVLKITSPHNYYIEIQIKAWDRTTGKEIEVTRENPNFEAPFYALKARKNTEYLLRFRNYRLFNFLAKISNFKPGESVLSAIKVQEGVHWATTGYQTGQWFRYHSNAEKEVLIATEDDALSGTTILVKEELSGLEIASDTIENSNKPEEQVLFQSKANTSYLIYIGNIGYSSNQKIYWDLKDNPLRCAAPQIITHNGSATILGNTDYWFEYKTSRRSRLIFTASGLSENQSVDIELYYSCDSLIVSAQNSANIYLEADREILIRTKGHLINGLYTLSVNDTEQISGTEEHPLEISTGTHQIQTNTDHWFIYHPISKGKIEIDMPADLSPIPRLEIFRPHEDSKYRTTRSHDFGKAATRCNPGEPLFIHWFNNNSDVSFEWTLTEKETVPGDLMTNALEAQEGINEMTKTNRMPTYYYYVPKSLGNIKISTCDLTNEDTFIAVYDSINQRSTSIFNGDACGNQSEIEFSCNPNDTVFFIWYEDYSNHPYSFSLSETSIPNGSERRDAHNATEGLNQVDFTETNIQWFEYTASLTGEIILSNCSVSTSLYQDVSVFKNDSRWDEDLKTEECGENKKSVGFDIKPGDTFYIKFTSDTTGTDINANWTLEEKFYDNGTHRISPLIIDEGLHTSTSKTALWFAYTAKNNSEITLSRCNIIDNVDGYLNPQIYKNDHTRENRIDTEACGENKKYSFHAIKDSVYYITWGYISDDQVQWELSESPYAENGYCQEALEVTEGINHAEHVRYQDIWYRFTTPHEGEIILSSVGLTEQDTEVELHSGCSDGIEHTELYSSHEYSGKEQAQMSWSCDSNRTYYIRWKGDNITAPYDWEFTYIKKGDTPDNPLEAVLGKNTRFATNDSIQYFEFGNSTDSYFYEITIPAEEGKERKLNISSSYGYSSVNGVSYNADSTEAEIQRPYYGSFIIECISEPADSFIFNIEQRYMDTLAVNTQLMGHTDFINDWFVLSEIKNAFYIIESDKPDKAIADIDLYSETLIADQKLTPMPSNLPFPVYRLFSNEENYLKWAMPEKGKTDYWWSLSQFKLSGTRKCVDAQPARPGNIHSIFNDYNVTYKMRPDKSGRYIISANSGELHRLGIQRLNLYRGTCTNKEWMGYVDFSDFRPEATVITSITLDSLAKNTSYYLNWEFGFFGNQIMEFNWNLKLDAEYDVSVQNPESEFFIINKNPNNGRFRVTCTELTEETTLEVYNINGNRIYSAIIQPPANQHTVDITGSPSGVYFVRLKNSTNTFTQKILIQKK